MAATEDRTKAEVVYSCLFTLFLCMNFTVRPNIPAPNTNRVRIAAMKFYLMFWMVLLPYSILYWAIKQWLAAREIARDYKARGWTAAHGHFLVMGGFVLYEEGTPCQVLSNERFQELVRQGHIEFPLISKQDLERRSHNHPLLGCICALQTSWFLIQIITRLSAHCGVAPLELSSFILVIMNLLLLIPFWTKPLDVHQHIRIDLLSPRVNPISLPVLRRPNTIFGDRDRETLRLMRIFLAPPQFLSSDPTVSHIPTKVVHTIFRSLRCIGRDILNLHIRTWAEDISPEALSVHHLYSPCEVDNVSAIFMAGVSGLLFAAAHIPLLFHSFHNHIDTLLWKISVISLTVFFGGPVIAFLCAFLVAWIAELITWPLWMRDNAVLGFLSGFAFLLLVVVGFTFFAPFVPGTLLARAFMVVEVFVDLKFTVPSTCRPSQWTDYMPHLS